MLVINMLLLLAFDGEREAEATALTRDTCAFYPDMAVHRFDELFADVESQAGTAHRSCQVALQAHELLEKQGYLVGWDAGAFVLDADTYL